MEFDFLKSKVTEVPGKGFRVTLTPVGGVSRNLGVLNRFEIGALLDDMETLRQQLLCARDELQG